ncbi:MAG: thioredoxin family protein [Bacilli bacterium]
MDTLVKLESVAQFEQLKQGSVVYVFSAAWCRDCVIIAPFMGEVAAQFETYTFVYINRDEWVDLCIENDIMGIPSFLAFKGGNEVGRFVSKDSKTREEIEEWLATLPS